MDLLEYAGISKNIKKNKIGIPYLGSKREISYDILNAIANHAPSAKYFFDLFGGGGAMAFNAHYNGYVAHYNELDKDIYLLFKFIIYQIEKNKRGKFGILPDEWHRFVTRAEFNDIKAQKPSAYRSFVLILYSFGNRCEQYFCGAEKESFKENGHYLILENKKECAKWWDDYFMDKGGLSGVYQYLQSEIYPTLTWQERRACFVDVTLKMEAIKIAQIAHLFQKKNNADTYKSVKDISQKDLCRLIDKHNPHLPKKIYKGTQSKGLTELKQLEQLQQLQRLEQLQRLQRLEQLQRLQRLEQLQRLENLYKITHSNLDYKEVKINTPPEETIIYLDPPYRDTIQYKVSKNSFDYERFYQWCIDKAKQGYNVFVSEYSMPQDRFKEVWSKETYAKFNTIQSEDGGKRKPQRVERLFVVL